MYGIFLVKNPKNSRKKTKKTKNNNATFGVRIDRRSGEFPKDPCVFGDNTNSLGKWWPFQICALRDGAVDHRQKSITFKKSDTSPTSTPEVFAIILNGSSDFENKDEGNEIKYARPPPSATGNKEPDLKTQALRSSIGTGNAVRVLRQAGTGPIGARRGRIPEYPLHGIRYDGLYEVVGEEAHPGNQGVWFVLRRVAGRSLTLKQCQQSAPDSTRQGRLMEVARKRYAH